MVGVGVCFLLALVLVTVLYIYGCCRCLFPIGFGTGDPVVHLWLV